jgi:hypothetical protein
MPFPELPYEYADTIVTGEITGVELTRYAGAGFAGKFTRRIPAERRILLS